MNIREVIEAHKKYFKMGQSKELIFRIDSLKRLREYIKKNEVQIIEALKNDLGKSDFEAYETEIGVVLEEINLVIKSLRKWSRPEKVKTPIAHFPSKSKVYKEPYGVVLIMSPWNYPFQLAITPLIGAIAGGNCAVIKPSEYSFYTSELIEELVKACFKKEHISVIRGGRQASQSLLEEKFDYIFFTGSAYVGRVVMQAAAKHLTPITLELGGKSPCIVEKTANIPLAAKRIIWGKYLNAGQTCVGVDYVVAHVSIKEQLVEEMKKQVKIFYGSNPIGNPEFTRIINHKHFERLIKLIDREKVVIGGDWSQEELKIEPTIMSNVEWGDLVMQEEIFGPILPIVEFEELGKVIRKINSYPKPLALYCFTRDNLVEEYILKEISFGGGCINDTIVHLANPYMRFGGVGESGMGGYHGKASFETFTHSKSILKKSNLIDIPLRYPPYKDKLEVLRKFMK